MMHLSQYSLHSKNWADLTWSEWVKLDGDNNDYKLIPNTSGVYRVRAIGREPLIYIGQTGRNLRERLKALRSGVTALDMPFNDPHTTAPNLWVWQKEANFQYECSAASIELSTPNRQALEDMLLWLHRVESKRSTLCNYGRFHSRWSKSLNRKKGVRGKLLIGNNENPNGGYSSPTLTLHGNAIDLDWMGLAWSALKPLEFDFIDNISHTGGVYRIVDMEKEEIIYIGESYNIRKRLATHCKSIWSVSKPYFSYAIPMGMDAVHRRHEIEVDLLGAYYHQYGYPPIHQY
ncbi:GIY-YIG nuclease family protein [Photobacterium leiognathi]|uniref:GIY-YIG nuclease family protein n=1 Tax=Photobacterium leiognathi TaxID=553611 RepID=UPI001EE13368|nr:GIY-YIG nuclease family protein [Photobacterium leiognathi]MCG3885100.1 GIY-YIG nuclease family protein [Photobacterium leiognathi]